MGRRFRLERLLRLKERVEDEAKAELGRVQSQLGQAEVALGQLRFVRKQIKLRRRADHVEVNDVFGTWAKMRLAAGGIIGKEILIQDTT